MRIVRNTVITAMMLLAVAPAMAHPKDGALPDKTDGSVIWDIGGEIPAYDGMAGQSAALFTPTQFHDIIEIQTYCTSAGLKDQYPSGASAGFALKLLIGTGIGAFTGGVLGALVGFGSQMSHHQDVQQGTFGGIESAGAAGGSGIVSGGMQNGVAKRISEGQCEDHRLGEYHRLGRLIGISAYLWDGTSKARGLKAPTNDPMPNWRALPDSDPRKHDYCLKQTTNPAICNSTNGSSSSQTSDDEEPSAAAAAKVG